MKKKIVFVLLAIIILTFPLQQNYLQQVHANVITKVGAAVAKQAAKVPIKDITKEIAFEMALQAIGQNFNEKSTYKFEENYSGYCMTEIKSDGSCGRVMQIKNNLTVEDLTAIDNQVGDEIDKAITNGKGLTRWQKFLDWFVPIWLVSAGATLITYAVDSDVRSFFDEVAFNTLVSLGIVKPAETETTEIDESFADNIPVVEEDIDLTTLPETIKFDSKKGTNYSAYFNELNEPMGTVAITATIFAPKPGDYHSFTAMNFGMNGNSSSTADYFLLGDGNAKVYGKQNTTAFPQTIMRQDIVNGLPVSVQMVGSYLGSPPTRTQSNFLQPLPGYNGTWNPSNPSQDGLRSITVRTPYYDGTNYVLEYSAVTKNNNKLKTKWFYPESAMSFLPATVTALFMGITTSQYNDKTKVFEITKDIPIYKTAVTPLPTSDELDNELISPPSKYEKDGKMSIIPPASIPITDTNGNPITVSPGETSTDPPVFTDKDGNIIPEDSVVVGEPNIVENPDGSTTVTPTPTPENPTPEPIPITPPEDAPIPPKDPTVPEGSSCAKDWEFPDFEPLENTMSEAFPFSIPWDMQNALESAFGTIGTERPEFDFKFNFNGAQTLKIGLPAFFDDWKPFTDTLLVFLFDIGIMFGIYRFMKGGSG